MGNYGVQFFSGERLLELRERRGMSKEELSVASGVPYQSIYSYEVERTHPKPDVIRKLAAGLGCDITDLFKPDEQINAAVRTLFPESNGAKKKAARVSD